MVIKMRINKKKLVVFDLDGTLNKTELYAVPAHQKAMADFNVPIVSEKEIIDTFGARGIDSVTKLIGDCTQQQADDYLHLVGKYETMFIKEKAGAFEGIPEMLCELKKLGYQTAVCSNASERYIRMVLDTLDLSQYIDFVQPLLPNMTKDETLGILIETVNPAIACMVGDRIFDKLAARKNCIPFIGCLYGFDKTEIADADITVLTGFDILTAVQMLIG
ncbi:MAG: HAD family hydrolase [Oscillospiraceae bacterium]